MNSEAWAGLVLVFGCLFGFRFAYELARLSEQLDAIGSTTPWDEIEPAGWKVFLYRVGTAGGALVGAGIVFSAIF